MIKFFSSPKGYELSPAAAANFTRKNLADYLRSRVTTHASKIHFFHI